MKPSAPKRVLLVPDKFKGTLSARQAGAAMAAGWSSVRPRDTLELLPMSDGGDGFGEILAQQLGARRRTIATVNAAHQPIRASWWWLPDQQLALVESARVLGLSQLPEKRFHPFQLDTFGLGAVFEAIRRRGARHCLIGIGGSATNDGGFGLATALGWKFINRQGQELQQWWELVQLYRLVPPPPLFPLSLTVAVDVSNPLLGSNGCSRIYGPQKGLNREDVRHAEKCLRRLSECFRCQFDHDLAAISGAGAAGGLGFGLMAFANAQPRSAFDVFARTTNLVQQIRQADLVVTGEGALDRQTTMGKGVGQVGQLCHQFGVPCVALAGTVQGRQSNALFWLTLALTDLTDAISAKQHARKYLTQLTRSLASSWNFG